MRANANTTTAFTTKLCKFAGTGYRVWARQLQLYLKVKDVWGAVLKPAPTSLQLENEQTGQADRPLQLRERPLDQLLLQQKLATTIILSALTEDQAALVADLPHPQAMLKALQKTYRHVCDTTVGSLKRQYLALYVDVGGDMVEHIRLTRLMLAELKCYKISLSDSEKKSNFLQSLGPDWNGYIGSLETCTTIDELLIKVAAEARHRATRTQRGKRSGAPAVRGGSAFTAATHGKSGVKKGKCFNCGKRGHFKNECKSKKRLIGAYGGRNNSQGCSGGEESGFVFYVSSVSDSLGADWIIDSGVSSHMTGARVLLSGPSKMDANVVITTANGMKLHATHRGKADLLLATDGMCTLDHVLFVPGLQRNLVSLSKVGAAGLTATFDHERCVITSGKSKLVATRRSSGLYVVEVPSTIRNAEAAYVSGYRLSDLSLWHARLGHLSVRDLIKVLKDGGVTTRDKQLRPCEACAAGKLASLPFLSKKPRKLKRGQVLIAIEYVGPMETTSRDGYTGLVSMMIEPYHLAAVFPVKEKSSATQLRVLRECIANLKVAVPKAKVSVLKSDNAAEYFPD